ncbi:MAG: twin-arginine translocation signal domain-containing protein, partial [Dysgonomonadaceae bacterium]|nr:twin-arginine translocation signal domain-containing protein [Dysgonamonadaceae bacterium]
MSTRRNFLKTAAIAGAGLATAPLASAAQKVPIVAPQKQRTPSKDGKIRVGFIGTGFRSQEHFNNVLSFDDAKIVAICDVSDFSLNMTKET